MPDMGGYIIDYRAIRGYIYHYVIIYEIAKDCNGIFCRSLIIDKDRTIWWV